MVTKPNQKRGLLSSVKSVVRIGQNIFNQKSNEDIKRISSQCFPILLESKESVISLHRLASVEIFTEMHLSFLLEDKTFYKSLYWFQIKFVTKRRLNSWSSSVLFSVWTIWWGLTGSINNWSLQSGPKNTQILAVSFNLKYTLRVKMLQYTKYS